MQNPRNESETLTRTLTPAQAGLLDLFTRDDIEVVTSDLGFVFELATFGSDGTLGDHERQALYTLWKIMRHYEKLHLEAHLLA